MLPHNFKESNAIIKTNNGWPDMPAYVGPKTVFVAWKFSKEDLELIQENGGLVYLQADCRQDMVVPMRMMVENPFVMPAPISVDVAIEDKAFVFFHEDNEVILLRVREDECNFKVDDIKDGSFMVTAALEALPKESLATNYVFYEEVKYLGRAREQNDVYNNLFQVMNVSPDNFIILERVNKTPRI